MKHIYILLLSFLFIGCSDNSEPLDQFAELSDSELIELIKSAADKQEVSINDMPNISQSFIAETFNFAIVQSIFHAPNLGYEVTMSRGVTTRTLMSLSSLINVYFNNDGEFLSNDFDSEFEEWDQNMCFDVEFPISVNLSDGSVVTISNEEELYDGIEEYYEIGEDNLPEINFPINIIFYYENENGVESEDLVEIDNYEELEMYFEMCEDGDDINDDEDIFYDYTCGEVVFPISIEDPNGVVFNSDNEESLLEYIDQWFIDNNCNTVDCGDFEVVYPISINYESGNDLITMTIQSEEMLEEINGQYCDD